MQNYEFVCSLSELPSGTRRCLTFSSSGRSVMLINVGGQVFCIDQACYHHGGPLLDGDIEDIGGRISVKCPWHGFQIELNTGEGLYLKAITTHNETGAPKVNSKGLKQRTHLVRLHDGNVYAADSSVLGIDMIPSDIFATPSCLHS